MRFGYRLMRGRQGVNGHARATGEKAVLSVRGLSPGESCALYALRGRDGYLLETRLTDREGCAQFITNADDRLFLVREGRVALWEDGPEAEEQFLLACAWLRAEGEKQAKKAGEADIPPTEEKPAPSTAEAAPETKETAADPPADTGRPLRQAGPGEAVDALPILRWPAGTEDLRLNCTLRPPFSPFYAPGWRFVQVPSPLPEAPFCAVGYRARDARVAEIAYAIPGKAQRPPVRLAGYHFRPGRGDQGYWVMTKRII